MEPTQTTPGAKSNNTLMISIAVVIILIIAGFFVFKNKPLNYENNNENTVPIEENIPANNLSNSDETADIEADLNSNSDIDTIDSDFK